MRSRYFAAFALVMSLSACDQGPNRAPPPSGAASYVSSSTKAITINGKIYRCVTADDTNMSGSRYQISTESQQRLLTPEAYAAGIQVKASGSSVAEFGNVVLYYVDRDDSCILWTEGLTNQEYSEKLGLTPLGLSPFYNPEKGATVSTATETPAPQGTPTPTPTPTASPSTAPKDIVK